MKSRAVTLNAIQFQERVPRRFVLHQDEYVLSIPRYQSILEDIYGDKIVRFDDSSLGAAFKYRNKRTSGREIHVHTVVRRDLPELVAHFVLGHEVGHARDMMKRPRITLIDAMRDFGIKNPDILKGIRDWEVREDIVGCYAFLLKYGIERFEELKQQAKRVRMEFLAEITPDMTIKLN